ncbi:putative alpha/beta fold family hydrolase [Aspergillus steynii IBT 23096]|uniref:Putative alpha/beta fold family hydrolase n=1 Tax=Aspergillus steynii IBT 23096 TaxID=1392250 RepID=A0A2I2FU71_9EURO|nr:putative alpha/beta fold family hydrolase [Aspergillus steynii IBT 23096]PLB44116.1 putative alpha/beta fold family hydrolase [Aspergillus steynii IBT 23096]
MSFATTDDGQEIYYELHGTSGPLLVCISGYFGVSDLWKPLISLLGSNYRCLTLDSRGYGRSSKPDTPELYSVPRHGEDVATVLKTAGLSAEPKILLTHSMGGNIASSYFLSHPTSVSGIIYTGTYYDGPNMARFLSREDLWAGAESPSKCVDFYANMKLSKDIAQEAAKWPAHIRKHNGIALASFAMAGRYAEITVPTAIIQGAEDFAGPIGITIDPMVAELPSCKLTTLPGVYHFPPTEAPFEVKQAIEDFIRAL